MYYVFYKSIKGVLTNILVLIVWSMLEYVAKCWNLLYNKPMKKMLFLVGMTGMLGIVELRSPNPGSQAEEISNLKQENKEIKQKITTLESKVNELSKKVEKQGSGSDAGVSVPKLREIKTIERKGGFLVGRDYSGHEFIDLTPEEIKAWKDETTIFCIKDDWDAEEIKEYFDKRGI